MTHINSLDWLGQVPWGYFFLLTSITVVSRTNLLSKEKIPSLCAPCIVHWGLGWMPTCPVVLCLKNPRESGICSFSRIRTQWSFFVDLALPLLLLTLQAPWVYAMSSVQSLVQDICIYSHSPWLSFGSLSNLLITCLFCPYSGTHWSFWISLPYLRASTAFWSLPREHPFGCHVSLWVCFLGCSQAVVASAWRILYPIMKLFWVF